MNPADRAQEIELEEYERNQAKGRLPAPERPSAKWCVGHGCGERIPEARRKALPGVQLCVDCQILFEETERRVKL
jgi:phage/conjugal plasmid C-4 type zinc finger TraR family protein